MNYKHISSPLIPSENKRVKAITIRLIIQGCTGVAYFTDLFLQTGTFATGWVGNVCELKWVLDG